MRFDCRQFVEHGADGFVIGALTAEQEIDVAFARELIEIIGARPVTFHRAFDVVRDPVTALRQLIELGVGRVLTSGQKRSVVDGKGLSFWYKLRIAIYTSFEKKLIPRYIFTF